MNNINLMLGDCLERMKEIPVGSVDLIVCDPPYKVISGGKPTKKGQPSGMLSKNDGKIFTHNNLREEDWFPIIYDKLKDNSHCYIMTNTLNLERYLRLAREAGFKLHNLIVWQKNNCTPNRWYMKNAEYTLFLRKGKAKAINLLGSKTVHSVDTEKGIKAHPTQKPVALMELYISNSSNEGDTILDFSMGSGTTGVAAINTNRNFIGIELDKNYFEIAKERIKAAKTEIDNSFLGG